MKFRKYLILFLILLACVVLCINSYTKQDNLAMRKFPYPYRAMLSIQSHIDGTTLSEFETIHTYLNTRQNTVYGDGLGLDIGDSFWLYNVNDGVEYRETDSSPVSDYMTWFDGISDTLNDADAIKRYWDLGWIDSIHSFGDFSRGDGESQCTRSLAIRGWEAMLSADVVPTVWINHGLPTNRQNFGGYTPFTTTKYQAGDDSSSDFYHTDISVKNGIKFVWNSINSSMFGMDNPLYLTHLRDGQLVWSFNAYTGYNDGSVYRYMWTPSLLCEVLTAENLDSLVDNGQYAIIANHFGSGDLWEVLGEHNLPAFRLLKEYRDRGDIFVVRSSRLLEYAAVRNNLKYSIDGDNIDIKSVDDIVVGNYVPCPSDLNGITFYVSDSEKALITICGEVVEEKYLSRNPKDETGKESIGFNWYK